MNTQTRTALETEIMDFLESSENPHDLRQIVRKFRTVADDASIKATLLSLSAEGLLEITQSWEFKPTVETLQ